MRRALLISALVVSIVALTAVMPTSSMAWFGRGYAGYGGYGGCGGYAGYGGYGGSYYGRYYRGRGWYGRRGYRVARHVGYHGRGWRR